MVQTRSDLIQLACTPSFRTKASLPVGCSCCDLQLQPTCLTYRLYNKVQAIPTLYMHTERYVRALGPCSKHPAPHTCTGFEVAGGCSELYNKFQQYLGAAVKLEAAPILVKRPDAKDTRKKNAKPIEVRVHACACVGVFLMCVAVRSDTLLCHAHLRPSCDVHA